LRARRAHVGGVVVHLAVAVVVDVVADLGGRSDDLHARQAVRPRPGGPADAGVGGVAAADVAQVRLGAGRARARHVVDHAVAVVVEGVAGLRRLGDRADAGARGRHALVGARAAARAPAGVAAVREVPRRAAGLGDPGIGEVLVDPAVAV